MADIEVPAGYSVRALTPPLALDGTVVSGFGRGSKELGCPTANLDRNDVGTSIADVPAGVYFGWAHLNGGSAEMMVMSIGWNPYYDNKEKTAEVHILKTFPKDFYGDRLSVAVTGFLRNELNFTSLQGLIDAINTDIRLAKHYLSVGSDFAEPAKNDDANAHTGTGAN